MWLVARDLSPQSPLIMVNFPNHSVRTREETWFEEEGEIEPGWMDSDVGRTGESGKANVWIRMYS